METRKLYLFWSRIEHHILLCKLVHVFFIPLLYWEWEYNSGLHVKRGLHVRKWKVKSKEEKKKKIKSDDILTSSHFPILNHYFNPNIVFSSISCIGKWKVNIFPWELFSNCKGRIIVRKIVGNFKAKTEFSMDAEIEPEGAQLMYQEKNQYITVFRWRTS